MGRAKGQAGASALDQFDRALGAHRGVLNESPIARALRCGDADELRASLHHLRAGESELVLQRIVSYRANGQWDDPQILDLAMYGTAEAAWSGWNVRLDELLHDQLERVYRRDPNNRKLPEQTTAQLQALAEQLHRFPTSLAYAQTLLLRVEHVQDRIALLADFPGDNPLQAFMRECLLDELGENPHLPSLCIEHRQLQADDELYLKAREQLLLNASANVDGQRALWKAARKHVVRCEHNGSAPDPELLTPLNDLTANVNGKLIDEQFAVLTDITYPQTPQAQMLQQTAAAQLAATYKRNPLHPPAVRLRAQLQRTLVSPEQYDVLSSSTGKELARSLAFSEGQSYKRAFTKQLAPELTWHSGDRDQAVHAAASNLAALAQERMESLLLHGGVYQEHQPSPQETLLSNMRSEIAWLNAELSSNGGYERWTQLHPLMEGRFAPQLDSLNGFDWEELWGLTLPPSNWEYANGHTTEDILGFAPADLVTNVRHRLENGPSSTSAYFNDDYEEERSRYDEYDGTADDDRNPW